MDTTTDNAPFSDLEPLDSLPEAENGVSDPTPEHTPLETAQADAQYWKEQALRTAAELDNFRKRTAKERQDAMKYANGSLLETLLPVIDNFEFGLQAARQEGKNSPVLLGMTMVQKEIPAVGLPFDPNLHEAVSQTVSAEAKEGTILSQIRRGYRLRDRLLRPSSVIVAAKPQPSES